MAGPHAHGSGLGRRQGPDPAAVRLRRDAGPRRRPRPRGGPRVPAARRLGLRRRAQGERPALGPRREDSGGRRPPEARDGRDRQRATSWRTSRPSSTKWPTAARVVTPTSRPRRATRRCPASSFSSAKTRRYPASHRLGPPWARARAQARLLAGPGRGRLLEDDPPDAVRHSGVQQGRARGEDPAPPRGGGRRAGRLQAEVEPAGHGPDDRGTRCGHPPFGWGRQGTLVAGRFTRRETDRVPAGPIALGAATAWTGPVLRFRSRLGSPPARSQNHSTIAPV